MKRKVIKLESELKMKDFKIKTMLETREEHFQIILDEIQCGKILALESKVGEKTQECKERASEQHQTQFLTLEDFSEYLKSLLKVPDKVGKRFSNETKTRKK